MQLEPDPTKPQSFHQAVTQAIFLSLSATTEARARTAGDLADELAAAGGLTKAEADICMDVAKVVWGEAGRPQGRAAERLHLERWMARIVHVWATREQPPLH